MTEPVGLLSLAARVSRRRSLGPSKSFRPVPAMQGATTRYRSSTSPASSSDRARTSTVSVQNTETNELATATTNEQGTYNIPFLRPGPYTVTVELSGFQKAVRSGLQLEVGQTATIDVALGVGDMTEEVTVTAQAVLETSNANRGDVIDNRRIAELPLQSRSPMALAALVAAGVGVTALVRRGRRPAS